MCSDFDGHNQFVDQCRPSQGAAGQSFAVSRAVSRARRNHMAGQMWPAGHVVDMSDLDCEVGSLVS